MADQDFIKDWHLIKKMVNYLILQWHSAAVDNLVVNRIKSNRKVVLDLPCIPI